MNDKDYEFIPQEFVEQIAKNGRASMYEMRNIARELKVLRAKHNEPKNVRWGGGSFIIDEGLHYKCPPSKLVPTTMCRATYKHPILGVVTCDQLDGHGGIAHTNHAKGYIWIS